MKENIKRIFITGLGFVIAFMLWTLLIKTIDVQPIGQNGTDIGFATLNCWFHKLTGVHMKLYVITDWLGLIPVLVCMMFGGFGFVQMVKRKSPLKVDYDLIFLGIYYVVVIAGYLLFETIPINYRPILIDGRMEASYPSSTTLLVLCVMPTLIEQMNRRLRCKAAKRLVRFFTICFSAFMVLGRLVSGVHWLTDIVGGVLLSIGLFYIYKGTVVLCSKNKI